MSKNTRGQLVKAVLLSPHAALAAVVAAAGVAGYWHLTRLNEQYDRLASEHARVVQSSAETKLLLDGFQLASPVPTSVDSPSIIFIGHIYPKNGYVYEKKPDFPNPYRPMDYLRAKMPHWQPQRVVFGGDAVYQPTMGALQFLQELKSELPNVRFLRGNHDGAAPPRDERGPVFEDLYGERFRSEDVNGVRLVYLSTNSKTKSGPSLDAEQQDGLRRALQGNSYRYAVVFLHHGLWTGTSSLSNTFYANADSLERDWRDHVVPMLVRGRVKGVFGGDGGVHRPGGKIELGGLPHYLSGWAAGRADILPEWLSIRLEEDSIQVTWHRLLGGDEYVKSD